MSRLNLFAETNDQKQLFNLIRHTQTLPVRKIPSSPKCQRRAAVAIIIRVLPTSVVRYPAPSKAGTVSPLDFLDAQWVKDGEPEVLFVRRAVNPTDRWSGHMAFPGGKCEPNESDQEAAERETLEEIGLDLTSPEFTCLGALDEREVKPPASGKPIMVLCPFVYLQLTPATPPLTLTPEEIASIHWIPLSFFLAAARNSRRWRPITFPIARHLLPARLFLTGSGTRVIPHTWLRVGLEKPLFWIFGSYSYKGLLLPSSVGEIVTPLPTPHHTRRPSSGLLDLQPHHVAAIEHTAHSGQSTADRLLLWGLTLWMTSDLVDLCHDPNEVPETALFDIGTPRYSHRDVDLIFGLLVRQFGASGNGGGARGGHGRKPAVLVTKE
ncbi:NUDIX hydrolase domain-like protein [Phlyctochytrium arcticum]|nr:NUDIX hydrolase domain-like protein [Phlyctochytrium arcticum]